MNTLKEEIKKLSDDQLYLKDQRKSVRNVGERKMAPWEAAYKHKNNSYKLRLMFAAYGLMKGKKFSEIENFYPEESHPLHRYQSDIDKIIAKHSVES